MIMDTVASGKVDNSWRVAGGRLVRAADTEGRLVFCSAAIAAIAAVALVTAAGVAAAAWFGTPGALVTAGRARSAVLDIAVAVGSDTVGIVALDTTFGRAAAEAAVAVGAAIDTGGLVRCNELNDAAVIVAAAAAAAAACSSPVDDPGAGGAETAAVACCFGLIENKDG